MECLKEQRDRSKGFVLMVAVTTFALTRCVSVPPSMHPQAGEGNVYSSMYHQTIKYGIAEFKVPDEAKFVAGLADDVFYVGSNGIVYSAATSQKKPISVGGILIPDTAHSLFGLGSGHFAYLDRDGYIYHTGTEKVILHSDRETGKVYDYPRLPDGVRFVFMGTDYIYYVDKNGGVYNAYTGQPMLNENNQKVAVPADSLCVVSAGSETEVLYMDKQGRWFTTNKNEKVPNMYVPANARHIFTAFNQICYVAPSKTDFQARIAAQQNGYVYEAVSHMNWGYMSKKEGKEVFEPFTIPNDALTVFAVEEVLLYHARDGYVYTADNKQKVEGVAIPVDARFVSRSQVGSGVTYVGADGNLYDALDGAMLSAIADEESEFQGVFIKESKTTHSTTITNEKGEAEEKEFSVTLIGTQKTIPPQAQNFFGATLYKTPTFLFVKDGYLYNAMAQQKPTPIFNKKEFPKGWNVAVPKYARLVFYAEKLSETGTDFYFVNAYDGCVYDLVYKTRMHANGIPYYIPKHAKFIVITDDGEILYTVDIPEPKGKK